MSRVDVTNWRGQASVGFRQVIDVEPRRWRTAADAFVAGAVAIEGFVASLVPARETARQARAKYQEYVRLVAAAAALTGTPSPLPGPSTPASGAMSTADRMRIGARADQMNTIAARGPDLGTIGGLAAQEVYAADALRRQAIELLTRARATIESVGNIAADALATAMDEAPAARRFDEATIRPAGATAAGHNTLDVVGIVPGLGEIADLTNAGWYLSKGHTLDAAVSMAGTIPLAGSAAVGGRLLRNAAKHSDRAVETAEKGAKAAGSSPGVLISGEGTGTRSINLNPEAADPRWGLTRNHLNKHLFGGGKHSLQTIDPAGNPDLWRNYMLDLAARPPTTDLGNGIEDIVGTFPKSDGVGTFKFGIRISRRDDGTFDLVTLLTRQ